MKQIVKNFLSLLLAAVLLLALLPATLLTASAADITLAGVSGLGVSYTATTNCSVTNGDNSLTINAKTSPATSSCGSTTPETARTQKVTLKNNKGGNAILSFNYSVTLSGGTVSVDGTSVTADGSFSKELTAGQTVVLSAASGSTSNNTTLAVTDIFLISNVTATVTFKPGANGTFTVNGDAITEETSMTNTAATAYNLVASPAEGYRLMDWYNESTGIPISADAETEVFFDASCTVVPRFIPADAPVFQVGNTKYTDLNTANTAAAAGTNKTIVLASGGTLPAGDYTVSSGVTLLVPFNDANTAVTNSNIKNNYEEYQQATEKVEYRRLTMASGANIAVSGCVNVSSRVYCMSTGQSGPYGLIQMESGSSMTFGSGATLQCFGYIKGDQGRITLNSGAKAYGSIFIADYPGSASLVGDLFNANVFPFYHFTVKNIQTPMRINDGAEMQVYMNLYGTSILVGYRDAWVKFVGSTSSYLFGTGGEGGYVEVSFPNSRQCVRLGGNATINPLDVTINSVHATTSGVDGLPIPYNYDIYVESGTTTLNENLICCRGSTVTVCEDATVIIPSGKSVYVMDATDDAQTSSFVSSKVDAKIDINGTVEVRGKFMTSLNKANITSSGKTGEFTLTAAIAADTTKSVTMKSDKSHTKAVTTYPASLNNGNGTYAETGGQPASTTFYWFDSMGGWATHEHHYVPEERAATCTESGGDVYTCDYPGCGDFYIENEVSALGHEYVNHPAQAATCTEPGWAAYQTCERCDYSTYVEIPAAHALVDHEAKAATCTEAGWKAYRTCSNCDYTTYVEIPALGHDYVNHPAQAATCTAAGWDAYRTCSRCDFTDKVEIPAAGHSYENHDAKAATCTDAGWNAYRTCANCDFTDKVEIPALDHDYVDHDAKAATCTEAGWNAYRTCSRCDYSSYSAIPALGHSIVTDSAASATCTEPGLTAGEHCTRCDYRVAQTAVPALGHDYVNHDAKAATCTEAGWNAYRTCSRCDFTDKVEIPAAGHSYENHDAKAATCTEGGWNAYRTCANCDYTDKVETSALGHDYVNHEAQAATCTEAGWNAYRTCSRCDFTDKVEIPAAGHSYENHDAKAATCTEAGWNAYRTCANCDFTDKVEIPALNHDWDEGTVTAAATEYEAGVMTYTCSRCDETKTEEIPALGHTHKPVPTEAAEPTCTAAGNSAYYTCSGCGLFFSDAACETQIEEDSWILPAAGHDYENHEAQAATCTGIGWDAYQTCKNCDYSSYAEIPALGHACVNHAAKAATCTEAGWNAYQTCSRCDYTTFEEISAQGHDYDEGFCTRCGEADPSNTAFKINSAKLALSENINVVYSATVPAAMTDVYMEFTINNAKYKVESSGTDSKGRSEFRLEKVNPYMMGDTICATLYATASSGQKVHATKASYSILEYCVNTLKKYPEQTKLQTLLSDILVYGTAAQKYTGHNTDALVTDLAAATEGVVLNPTEFADVTVSAFRRTGTADPNYKWTGATLSCGGQVAILFYLTVEGESSATVEITVNGRKTVFALSDLEKDPSGKYTIVFRGFNAAEFDDVVTAIIKENGEQTGQTMTYSVNSYIMGVQHCSSEKLAELAQAIRNYGVSAKNYLSK